MLDKLKIIEDRYEELEKLISDPETMKDMDKFQKLCKEHADLEDIVKVARSYSKNIEILNEDKELLGTTDEEEMRELLKEDIAEKEKNIEKQEEEIKILLLPKDPNDEKNVIVEIRAGAGGDEAGLFAKDLLECIQCMQTLRAGGLKLWRWMTREQAA